jgi:hypothetical protein
VSHFTIIPHHGFPWKRRNPTRPSYLRVSIICHLLVLFAYLNIHLLVAMLAFNLRSTRTIQRAVDRHNGDRIGSEKANR